MTGSRFFNQWRSLLVLLAFVASSSRADDTSFELEKLKLKYAIESEQFSEPIEKLKSQFKARLQEIQDAYQKQGKLEETLIAKAAVAAEAAPDPKQLADMPAEIRMAQTIYLEQLAIKEKQRAAKLNGLDLAYQRKLATLHSSFVAMGESEQAETIKAEMGIVGQRLEAAWAESLDPCSVTVSSTHKLSVHPLEAGAQRLSGRYRPKFDSIAEELEGFQFTRIPWHTTPTNEVTALEDGFFYVFSISKPPTVDADVSKVLVEKMIRGPYLNKAGMYRINLKRGQSLTCKGGECGVIAKKITLK